MNFKEYHESWTQPGKVLYIMRGVSGSGKSTLAKQIQEKEGGVIYSTDEFHYVNGEYKFDPEKKDDYHAKNVRRAEVAIRSGISPILIDNTNVRFKYAKPYIKEALKFGYEIKLVEPNTSWAFDAKELAKKNSGRAPAEIIQKMIDEWEPHDVFMTKVDQFKNGIDPE